MKEHIHEVFVMKIQRLNSNYRVIDVQQGSESTLSKDSKDGPQSTTKVLWLSEIGSDDLWSSPVTGTVKDSS